MRRAPKTDLPLLDEDSPHSEARSRQQIDGLRKLLGRKPRRVLDLGCGAGRTLVPLAALGHELIGVDVRRKALVECRAGLKKAGAPGRLIHGDFLKSWPRGKTGIGKFDAILLLGNTLMTIVDVHAAADLFRRAARVLKPGGRLIIDDFPREFWTELADGRWINGLGASGRVQLVWKPGDAVFALRSGVQVDPRSWSIKRGDRLFRLWCEGSLGLLAAAAGLSGPRRIPQSGLIVMRRRKT